MDHKKQKETLYFLEWIAQESGFNEDQILENMRPENQKLEFIVIIHLKSF